MRTLKTMASLSLSLWLRGVLTTLIQHASSLCDVPMFAKISVSKIDVVHVAVLVARVESGNLCPMLERGSKQKSEFTSAIVAYVYSVFYWKNQHVANQIIACLAE